MKRILLLAASFFLVMGMSAQERRADGTGYERKVVVEELTGTACGWCPRGLVGMKMLRDLYGDRFIGVAVHQFNATDPMYTPDYADILAAEDQTTPATATGESAQDALINSFIAQEREKEKEVTNIPQHHIDEHDVAEIADTPIEQPVERDDSMLSESLAKMYIKRRNYSKALEIIENINLNFPEKSIYFADQIRFLRKLVLNEKTKK